MKIIIDKIKEEDVRDYKKVHVDSWLSAHISPEYGISREDILVFFGNDYDSEEKVKFLQDKIKNNELKRNIFVAKDLDNNSKVIGFVRTQVDSEKNYLEALYLDPEYQGKGVARMLYEKVFPFFDSNRDIVLEVAAFNTRAIKFYQKLGFSPTGKWYDREDFKFPSGANMPILEMALFRNKKIEKNKVLVNTFTSIYGGGREVVALYKDIESYEEVRDFKIKTVCLFGFHNGKLVVVHDKDKDSWGLIAGSLEQGESVEQAEDRETKEESNMRIIERKIIGYQVIFDKKGHTFQTRTYATLEPIGPFVSDPDGDIDTIKEVDLSEAKNYFNWGIVGDHLLERVGEMKGK